MQNNLTLFAEIPQPLQVIAWGVLGVLLLIVFVVLINFFSIWIRALFSGARVTYTELIALRLRNVPVGVVVDTRITAVKSGLEVTIDDLSTHYLAGGNIEMVVRSEEHTSELQSQSNLVCRLLLEKKNNTLSLTNRTLIRIQRV